ncbi:MAG: D-alanyl-D-alanine carboxypeptidase family protein [Thiohalorhabdus sp.]|uniref:D-alanyl-D-alanine carboxypeptidase family protein n=1 Tax=Thiohalorhabdus sp. TaxID=3094134 RepID=UPI003980E65B
MADTVSSFVGMMNHQAEALGMENTHFTNPSGLGNADQYTTARDMGILARALIRDFPRHYPRFHQRKVTHNGITQHNRNRLPEYSEGADGLITGHAPDAGYHLVASAQRGKTRFLSVLLGAESGEARFQDAVATLDYGLRYFETIPVYQAGQPVREVRVWKGAANEVTTGLNADLFLTIPRHRKDALDVKAETRDPLSAPIDPGERVGWLQVSLDGESLAHRPLVTRDGVAWGGWLRYVMDSVQLKWNRFWQRQQRKLLAHDKETSGNEPQG